LPHSCERSNPKTRHMHTAKISPHPRSISSMCKQVSRLGFILLGRLPAFWQWLTVSVRRLHGYWDSPELSSAFPQGQSPRRIAAHKHTLFTSSSLYRKPRKLSIVFYRLKNREFPFLEIPGCAGAIFEKSVPEHLLQWIVQQPLRSGMPARRHQWLGSRVWFLRSCRSASEAGCTCPCIWTVH